MNKRIQYFELVKRLLNCENRIELSDSIKQVNEFNRKYSISSDSEEYKKFETVIGLMKIKLRNKYEMSETKNRKVKIQVTESELVNIITRIVESDDDDMSSRMKRRHGALLAIIQDEVAQESNPDNFGDEFEFADNILSWSIDRFISQPGNEWLEDRHDELLDYAKEEFGEELFEVYRDLEGDEDFDDDDFDM